MNMQELLDAYHKARPCLEEDRKEMAAGRPNFLNPDLLSHKARAAEWSLTGRPFFGFPLTMAIVIRLDFANQDYHTFHLYTKEGYTYSMVLYDWEEWRFTNMVQLLLQYEYFDPHFLDCAIISYKERHDAPAEILHMSERWKEHLDWLNGSKPKIASCQLDPAKYMEKLQ